jgi:hypothetical protein
MVEDGNLEIEGYQEKCRNCNLPHMQKRGGIEPHFEMWREEILDKRFRNCDPEIGIRKIAGCKNKEIWQKLGLYLSRYRGKWERMIKKNECDDMSNLD